MTQPMGTSSFPWAFPASAMARRIQYSWFLSPMLKI
jgi:hypothetical protein